MPTAIISALGCYTPPGVLTNDDLSKMVETSDAWITERTGIRERRIADKSIATSDMAIAAARIVLEEKGIDPASLDAIIVCTVTPDMPFPSTACLVQHAIGAVRCWGFDLLRRARAFYMA